jgi:hypothetical protein
MVGLMLIIGQGNPKLSLREKRRKEISECIVTQQPPKLPAFKFRCLPVQEK